MIYDLEFFRDGEGGMFLVDVKIRILACDRLQFWE